MKYWIFPVFLFLIVIISSCRPVVRLMYGVKKPGFESTRSVLYFQSSVFGPVDELYSLKAEAWQHGIKFSVPDVYVYSRQGKFIPYKDRAKPNCNGPAEQFLEELDPQRNYLMDENPDLNSFISNLEKVDCSGEAELTNQDFDFYIFLTWANWTGKKIYREKTLEWLQAIRAKSNIRAKVAMINMDFRECWDEETKNWFRNLKVKN